DVSAVGHGRSDRARRWDPRHWLRRTVCAGGGQGPCAEHRSGRASNCRAGARGRGVDLRLHKQHSGDRRVVMAILLPETLSASTETLTPRQIVAELDKYVIGQKQAKRAVAIALRNRMRRQKLSPELAEEVVPKNILMIGPTGVGKTEIARRLARLAQSPF